MFHPMFSLTTRLLVLLLFAGLLVPTVPLVAADDAPDDILTPDLSVSLRTVREVALSADGNHVAYTLDIPREDGEEPGSSYRELWVANLEKGKVRRYTHGKERIAQPAFSPDGKRITFRARRPDMNPEGQIYTMRLRGGEARPLTDHPASVGPYRWSADGSSIAFLARDAETDEEKDAKKAGRDWKVHDADPTWTRLWLFDVGKKDFRQVVDADLDIKDMVWTPDGTTLIFRAAPTPAVDDDMMRNQLYAVRLADGAMVRLLETPGKLGGMEVSPDGHQLAYLGAVSTNDPLAQSIFVVDLGGLDGALDAAVGEAAAGKTAADFAAVLSAPRNLTEAFEASVSSISYQDAETLLAVVVEGSRNALYHVDVTDGARRSLSWSGDALTALDLVPGASKMALVAHAAEHPRELFVANADGSSVRRVHDHNPELEGIRLARQEVIEWEGPDGLRIEGVVTYPLDYEPGKSYPLVLQIHGGPEGVSLDGWTTSAGYPVQHLAADGFVVLQPNYRGSQGRGVAFTKADHDDLGGLEFDDVLAGVDHLVDQGMVDPDRVGTGGWSYGGYMSAWAATRWSERFQAAVMGAGIANWVSFAGTTDIPREMALVHWNSFWYDEPELHWERSPAAHLNKARTPTMILHGAEDTRVPPSQGLELYTGLRQKGVDVTYIEYPREPHGLNEREHQLDAIERVRQFFGEHLDVPEIGRIEERRD